MRITITAEGGQPVTLADHGREGPEGWTVVPQRRVETLAFVQGQFAGPKNRGNTLHVMRFSRAIEFATYAEAQSYVAMLNTAIPAEGALFVEYEDQASGFNAAQATVEVSPLPIAGVLLIVAYTIKYGAVAEWPEPLPPVTEDEPDPANVVASDGLPITTSDGKTVQVQGEINET